MDIENNNKNKKSSKSIGPIRERKARICVLGDLNSGKSLIINSLKQHISNSNDCLKISKQDKSKLLLKENKLYEISFFECNDIERSYNEIKNSDFLIITSLLDKQELTGLTKILGKVAEYRYENNIFIFGNNKNSNLYSDPEDIFMDYNVLPNLFPEIENNFKVDKFFYITDFSNINSCGIILEEIIIKIKQKLPIFENNFCSDCIIF